MDDLLKDFLTETAENIGQLDVEIVRLEQEPDSPELIGNIFRIAHTIKGTCGFLGLPRLEGVAHAAENVLGRIRDKKMAASADTVSIILESIDRIKAILTGLEINEAEPQGDDSDLIGRLNAMAEGAAAAPEPAPATAEAPPASAPEPAAAAAEESKETAMPQAMPAVGEAEEESKPAASGKRKANGKAAAEEASPEGERRAGEPSVATQNIRVSVHLLENLMTTVSELVLVRNQLLQKVRGHADSEFTVPLQRLSHITTDLQEGVMKTRMQPIGNAWAKLPRIVRDLAHELGKKIELEMRGAETELDRQVLEMIKDPLTHMVRNSGDHGLETPEERKAAGKSETGRILLDAYHEGGHIIVQIVDDGRGIDLAKVREKIVANGLATETDLEIMSDQQILQYIFRPGFSTAQKVTAVSGRGVGMDVVKTNIEKIGGTVELTSQQGRGTKFTIKIPLTLAIVAALIVEAAGERFAIPQISVIELVRVRRGSAHKIESIKGTLVLRLRDRLLPLVSLAEVLGLGVGGIDKTAEQFIVVAQLGNYTFGIIVDQVFDTEEIVVKPVAPILRDISIFSGNTILGDGSVVMILDPNGIAAKTGQSVHGEETDAEGGAGRERAGSEKIQMLIFHAAGGEPKAVPLALVARLEEIERSKIETSGGRHMVQYRGQLMPLVSLPGSELKAEGRQPVIVFTDAGRSMGVVVDDIVDIAEEALDVGMKGTQPGFIGTAVIAGKATNIIDVAYFLEQAFGDWSGNERSAKAGQANERSRLLLIDDNPFFRNLLYPVLTAAGYQVTLAADATSALKLRDAGEEFDVIVSDIEMPGMDGFTFAQACRTDERWQRTPLVALSSHTGPQYFERGRQAGFTDYVAKNDRDALLSALNETLSILGGVA